ncbi:hypothetical protein GA0074692_1611 [Micromonospora pallida]|uniref:Uncharacterized protein n=1 Tax=Micromonospora pallida TaxID=145854 RepID=A0A1C6S2P5_9ACTN|nr:DUF5682 family protein [Micromonospora pallida]SCL23602.1 hypothetical protein GA0074692_1611 [Micromonospora pallida]
MPEQLYGIRHHGPGSARAVVAALAEQRPDILLVEGPPEAEELLRWVADERLEPPVALLGYATDDPRRAGFWPFAVFSPEWQAIRWAVEHGVPVRFFDLPYAYRLAEPQPDAGAEPSDDPEPGDRPELNDGPNTNGRPEPSGGPGPSGGPDPIGGPEPGSAPGAEAGPEAEAGTDDPPPRRPVDPIAELAAAAGYDDPERWWEDVVEHRGAPAFTAIAEAMTAIRDGAPEDPDDLLREAHMRTVLRQVRRSHDNIAVVCGAWHVPALARKVPASADNALLKGRRKAKVTFTWVPWTYGRLASWQGYAAGVRSPGWYHHLFTSENEVVVRWLVAAAGVLREEGVPASSAHVIEAARLAETLATLRGRPLAGLTELTDASAAVLCEGDPLRLELIGRRLVVGERLGGVPDDMPAVPLARDLAAQQRTLRLKPEALERPLDLDLRRDNDLARSRLLHRLRMLGVPWGELDQRQRSTGTFREQWRLRWQPEFAVRLVEASAHGTTVVSAATAAVATAAREADSLAEVTALVEVCLLADLTDAYPPVLRALDTRAALDADVAHLMAAIPPLVRTLRYGDVRRSELGGLSSVTTGLLARVRAGLPAAVSALAEEAARELRGHLDAVHAAVNLLDDDPRERWLDTLASVADRDDLHGLLAGRLVRLLHDAGRLERAEVRRRMGLPLTAGVAPADGAAWVEGFLGGGGLLLVHDDALLSLVDEWLAAVPADSFTEVLPLLRRTFGSFAAGERRAIGDRVAHRGAAVDRRPTADLDHDRAAAVLPTLGILLGREIR